MKKNANKMYMEILKDYQRRHPLEVDLHAVKKKRRESLRSKLPVHEYQYPTSR